MGGSACVDFGLTSSGNSDMWFPTPSNPGDRLNYTFTLKEDDRIECRTVTMRAPPPSTHASVAFPEFEFGYPSYNVLPCGGAASSEQCGYKTCRNCVNPEKRWISVSGSLDVCYCDERHKCGEAGDEVVGAFVVPLPVVITIVNTDFPDLFGFDPGYFTTDVTLVSPPSPSPSASPSLSPRVASSTTPSVVPTTERVYTSAPVQSPDSGGNSAAIIAGSVIGAVVAVIIAAYAGCYAWLRRSTSQPNTPSPGPNVAPPSTSGLREEVSANDWTSPAGAQQPPPAYAPSYVPTATAIPVGEIPVTASAAPSVPVAPSAPPLVSVIREADERIKNIYAIQS